MGLCHQCLGGTPTDDRRVLLVSDKNDGDTFLPIHKEDGTAFVAEDPGLPVMVVDGSGKYRILTTAMLGGGGSTVVTDIEDGAGDSIMDPTLNAAQVSVVNQSTVLQGGAPWSFEDDDLIASVTVTANNQGVVVPVLLGHNMVGIRATGSWGGKLTLQGTTADVSGGVPYDDIPVFVPSQPLRLTGISASGTGNSGRFAGIVSGYRFVRIVSGASPAWSGSATIFIYATKALYDYRESSDVTVVGSSTRTTSGTDAPPITNYFCNGLEVYIIIQGVVGSVPRPVVRLQRSVAGMLKKVAEFQKPGDCVAGEVLKYLFEPAASGGTWDGIAAFKPGRSNELHVVWTLPGGTSVTRQVDISLIL